MTTDHMQKCQAVMRRGNYERLYSAIKAFQDDGADPKVGPYAEALDQMSKVKAEMLREGQTP